MAGKGKGRAPALSHLSELSNFLGVAIAGLSGSNVATSSASSSSSPSSIPTILSDLQVLFTQISKETTALSLAFAPPSESWDAVLATSQKLYEISSKIVYCLSLLRSQALPSTSTSTAPAESLLAKEYRFATLSTLEALKDLVETCCKTYDALPAESKIATDQRKKILTLTSLVWKAVERTEKLSKDEEEAFRKVWKGMMEMLEDALSEMEELSQREVSDAAPNAAQEKDEEEEEDFFDDEGDDSPLSKAEMDIVQTAFQLSKFVKALFKKISLSASLFHNSKLDRPVQLFSWLHQTGQALLAIQDDLASALYPPQNRSDILQISQKYRKLAVELCTIVRDGSLFAGKDNEAELEEGIKGMSVGDKQPEKQDVILRKWLLACQAQIERSVKELEGHCSALGR